MPKAPKVKIGESKKIVHPFSRKAAQSAKKEHHNAKIEKRKQEFGIKLEVQGEKMQWFRDHLQDSDAYEKSSVLEIVETYLHRFDEELEQIEIKNSIKGRRGNQHASRGDSIRFTLEKERREFDTSGLEIPDLFHPKDVEYLRNWQGELRFLSNIKTKNVKRSDLM